MPLRMTKLDYTVTFIPVILQKHYIQKIGTAIQLATSCKFLTVEIASYLV